MSVTLRVLPSAIPSVTDSMPSLSADRDIVDDYLQKYPMFKVDRITHTLKCQLEEGEDMINVVQI